jgi:hypothetical protein
MPLIDVEAVIHIVEFPATISPLLRETTKAELAPKECVLSVLSPSASVLLSDLETTRKHPMIDCDPKSNLAACDIHFARFSYRQKAP